MKLAALLLSVLVVSVASIGDKIWGQRFIVNNETYDKLICSENIVKEPMEGKNAHESYACTPPPPVTSYSRGRITFIEAIDHMEHPVQCRRYRSEPVIQEGGEGLGFVKIGMSSLVDELLNYTINVYGYKL